VLDEPNSNLDRIGEQALMRALAEAKARGVTVLVITQREMVLGIADKLLRLHEGKLTDFDDREKVERKYGARPGAPMPGEAPAAAVAGVGARFIQPVRGREPGAS
jgi:ABC-type protease/lipase transport system fused ATPase/permease subunit